MRRNQARLRFTADPDPRYCARAFCRVPRLKTATYTVTMPEQTFNVCSSCARAWESVRGATVTKIKKGVV